MYVCQRILDPQRRLWKPQELPAPLWSRKNVQKIIKIFKNIENYRGVDMYGAFCSCRYWYGLPCNFVIYKSSAPFHWMDVSFWAQFEPRRLFKLYWSKKIASKILNFDRNTFIFVKWCNQRRFSLRRLLGRRQCAFNVRQIWQMSQRRPTCPENV